MSRVQHIYERKNILSLFEVYIRMLTCLKITYPNHYRLDPNKFVESIRILLKNNAPNEDFHAFYERVLDSNVSLTIKSNICISHFCCDFNQFGTFNIDDIQKGIRIFGPILVLAEQGVNMSPSVSSFPR